MRGLAGLGLAQESAPEPDVRHVLAMFKCHFDAGFVDTQTRVVEKYFKVYFPQAIQVGAERRATGKAPYVWTTGSWLLYEYLEQASAEDRRRMEAAIANGDIAWHALPFSWQTELMTQSEMVGALALAQSLDRRFGHKSTGAKMTDVPGHTRALVAPLVVHGVSFLDIGVNGGSRPAELPPLFRWKNAAGQMLTVMYHHEYGDVQTVPGSDLAIAIVVRGDNSGPHRMDEIDAIFAALAKQYPHAKISATNLATIANAVEPFAANLPLVTQEIGDTWIHGIASDPLKVARYREMSRMREGWIASGRFAAGDATDTALLRTMLLEVEHTWGTDTKTWLDFDHYIPADLKPMLTTHNYEVVQSSWQEKRNDLLEGIGTLPGAQREEARAAIASLAPSRPVLAGGKAHAGGETIEAKHFRLRIDAKTGALTHLEVKATGRNWATPEQPLALFSCQTLSEADYRHFFAEYIVKQADWVAKDFGKPNMDKFGAVSQTWNAVETTTSVAHGADGVRVLSRLVLRDDAAIASGRAAFPEEVYLELILPNEEPRVDLNFYWFGKQPTRMAEAMWLTFQPPVENTAGWSMDKSGERVSPMDVVTAGSRHLHSLGKGFAYRNGRGSLEVETIDAPLVAVGERSPLNFSRAQPDLAQGIHSNLFNNAWGTNYIMWFSEDMRLRYRLRTS
jgi:hypothetical protein